MLHSFARPRSVPLPMPLRLIPSVFATLLSTFAVDLRAQWELPVPLALIAPGEEDRQVIGLADPTVPHAAASVDAVRAGTMNYAVASGTDLLVASLTPAPSAYSTGMVVTLVPLITNNAGASMDLNGLGTRAILKAGGLPLDSADVEAGVPVRMIYDGTDFRVLSSTTLPCRTGSHAGSREYCIEDSSSTAATFFEAVVTCTGRNARLCTYSEWVHACMTGPGFLGTVVDYEWVDDAANHVDTAKRVGNGGGWTGPDGIDCKHGGNALPTSPQRFRCCSHR